MTKFFKYQATGNDFILLEEGDFSVPFYAFLCNRHLGIGADGILIPRKKGNSFYMEYRNSDGKLSSFCGNGSRAFVKFLSEKYGKNSWNFLAQDGEHFGERTTRNSVKVSLNIFEETFEKHSENEYFLDSGSPHYVVFIKENVADFKDFTKFAEEIRFDKRRFPEGTNVNIVNVLAEGKIRMRTYERGMDAETLSCGTGTVAAAWIYNFLQKRNEVVNVVTKGGTLKVSFPEKGTAELEGQAHKVFEGTFDTENLIRQMKETNYVMLERKM